MFVSRPSVDAVQRHASCSTTVMSDAMSQVSEADWRQEQPTSAKKKALVVKLRRGQVATSSYDACTRSQNAYIALHSLLLLQDENAHSCRPDAPLAVPGLVGLRHRVALSSVQSQHKVFPRQELAFAFVDSKASESNSHSSTSSSNWRVLSQELNSKGIRQFVAWQWSAFEQWYLSSRDYVPGNNKNSQQHHYEVIREGCPCRLYFDLEFQRQFNVHLDGDELVLLLFKAVIELLQSQYSITVTLDNFLQLDSTTPTKFSRHVIVHLPDDQLFTDNAHVGRFVNDVVASMAHSTDYSVVAASNSSSSSAHSSDDMQQSRTTTIQCCTESTAQHISNSAQQQQQQEQYTQLSQDDYGLSALYLTQDTEGNSGQTDDCATAVNEYTQCTTMSQQQCSTSDNELVSKQLPHNRDSSSSRSGVLWVNTDDTGKQQKACFVDVSVYSRNRCFRMLHSSKYGKTAKLRLAACNTRVEWQPSGINDNSSNHVNSSSSSDFKAQAQLLRDSLIVPVDACASSSSNNKSKWIVVPDSRTHYSNGTIGQYTVYSQHAPHQQQQQQQQQQQNANSSSSSCAASLCRSTDGFKAHGGKSAMILYVEQCKCGAVPQCYNF
eukprot:14840-Heterococcus_DN1.PRE.2